MLSCDAIDGYVRSGDDCDDADPERFLGAAEDCATGFDANCDGVLETSCDAGKRATAVLEPAGGSSPIRGIEATTDLDGDGLPDLIIPDGGQCPGLADVVNSASALAKCGDCKVEEVGTVVEDPGACDSSGWYVGGSVLHSIGDVDGDGRPELLHGNAMENAYGGRLTVLSSPADLPGTINLDSAGIAAYSHPESGRYVESTGTVFGTGAAAVVLLYVSVDTLVGLRASDVVPTSDVQDPRVAALIRVEPGSNSGVGVHCGRIAPRRHGRRWRRRGRLPWRRRCVRD